MTAAATAAVALVLIAGGIATVATFADRERSSLDRELESAAQGPAGGAPRDRRPRRRSRRWAEVPLDGPEARGAPGPPGLLAESGSFVRVVSDGQVLRAAGDVPDEGLSDAQGPGLRDGRRRRRQVAHPHDPAAAAARFRQRRPSG